MRRKGTAGGIDCAALNVLRAWPIRSELLTRWLRAFGSQRVGSIERPERAPCPACDVGATAALTIATWTDGLNTAGRPQRPSKEPQVQCRRTEA